MLLQEFIQRTGTQPTTTKEFENIHQMYMSTQLDKDAFCKEYKKYGTSTLVKELNSHITSLNEEIKELHSLRKEEISENTELAEFLIGKSAALDDIDLYNQAIRMIGQKRCIIYKLQYGIQLIESDIEYIKNNLK